MDAFQRIKHFCGTLTPLLELSSDQWAWVKLCVGFVPSKQRLFHVCVITVASRGSWRGSGHSVLLIFSKSLQMSCFGNMGILWEQIKPMEGVCVFVCECKGGQQQPKSHRYMCAYPTGRCCACVFDSVSPCPCMWEKILTTRQAGCRSASACCSACLNRGLLMLRRLPGLKGCCVFSY